MGNINLNFDFSNLTTLYVGQFGEQLVKLYFIVNGIDTYEPLIDDKGIDFVARVNDEKFYDIQVKTIRLKKEPSYIFFHKKSWGNKLRDNLLVAVVVLEAEKSPQLLLIPASAWQTATDDKIFADRNYEGKKSPPEWGLTITLKKLPYLVEKYDIHKMLPNLKK
jgi:hypothetical protein